MAPTELQQLLLFGHPFPPSPALTSSKMPRVTLTLTNPTGQHEQRLEVDDPSQTTITDLVDLLFSVTDIPPDNLIISTPDTPLYPSQNPSTTLTDLSLTSKTILHYRDNRVPATAFNLTDLQAALRACTSLSPPGPHRPSPNTAKFLATVRTYQKAVEEYEIPSVQEAALKHIPLTTLRASAASDVQSNKHPTIDKALLKQLLHWFKTSFFTWVDAPSCWSCGKPTTATGMVAPTPSERAHRASRVELYHCGNCRASVRFPRYNDPVKLLETRLGRCGEWAQAFTLCARAAGLCVRAVHDWTDHVWTEVYCEEGDGTGRWVHADACEDVMDEPLLYEQGWGKKLNYCVATGVDCVVDVTRRYTADFDKLIARRTLTDEGALQCGLREMNDEIVAKLPKEQADDAVKRYAEEGPQVMLRFDGGSQLPGRQSGSAAWVRSRGEDGASK